MFNFTRNRNVEWGKDFICRQLQTQFSENINISTCLISLSTFSPSIPSLYHSFRFYFYLFTNRTLVKSAVTYKCEGQYYAFSPWVIITIWRSQLFPSFWIILLKLSLHPCFCMVLSLPWIMLKHSSLLVLLLLSFILAMCSKASTFHISVNFIQS